MNPQEVFKLVISRGLYSERQQRMTKALASAYDCGLISFNDWSNTYDELKAYVGFHRSLPDALMYSSTSNKLLSILGFSHKGSGHYKKCVAIYLNWSNRPFIKSL